MQLSANKVFATFCLKLDTFVDIRFQISPWPTLNQTTATKGKLFSEQE